jgi:hypothetical protein
MCFVHIPNDVRFLTGATDGFERRREVENALLFEDGFEPVQSDLLWVKECVCYVREAALQTIRRV